MYTCGQLSKKCITLTQLKDWESEGNQEKLDEAKKNAKRCVLCRRIWLRFLASKKAKILKLGSKR
jgi:hypothetical protein